MSTKIYNGYISKLGINELLEKFKPLVKEFSRIKIEGYSEHLVSETVFEIDRMHYKGEDISPGDNKQPDILYKNFKEDEKKVNETIKKGIREPWLDFTASCTVFPMKKSKTLILFYSDNNKVSDFWEKLDYISEYHYQDQTDKPEEISDYLWRKREEDWNKALGGNWGKPIDNGYGFTFSDERLPWYPDIEKIKTIPSKEKRALNLLHDIFLDKAVNEIRTENKEEKFSGSMYFAAKEKWVEHKKTDAFKKEMKETQEKLIEIDLTYKQQQ